MAPLLGTALLAFPSCGGDGGTLAGESMHFRLFVADGLDAQVAVKASVDEILVRLETNWADTATLLRTPNGRIDYHLITTAAIADRCGGGLDVTACEQDHSVFTTLAVDQHELNHAYMELVSTRDPAPILLEGLADAIGCSYGGPPPREFGDVPDWRNVVNYAAHGDVYGPGREFVRYLILTQGIDAFVSYYLQAPNTRDPAAFADNFSTYWSLDMDPVWAAMQVAQPAWAVGEVHSICPCSLPPWTGSASPAPIASTPTSPYWTWPELGGDTAVWTGNLGSVAIRDCNAESLTELSSFNVVFARLQGPLYAELSTATVARGPFLSDTCADAAVYALPSALISVNGNAEMDLVLSRPPGMASSVYLTLEMPTPMTLASEFGLGTISLCSGCHVTGTDCQPLPRSPGAVAISGQIHLRWDEPATSWPYAMASMRASLP